MVRTGLSGLQRPACLCRLGSECDLEVYLNAVAEHTPSIAGEKNIAHLADNVQASTVLANQDSVSCCRCILRY